jgi:hypothetical protein
MGMLHVTQHIALFDDLVNAPNYLKFPFGFLQAKVGFVAACSKKAENEGGPSRAEGIDSAWTEWTFECPRLECG